MSWRQTRFSLCLVVVVSMALTSCRGSYSKKPPVHPQQNMDQQKRIDPQEPSSLFKDGRGMRLPPKGTVASTMADDDIHLQADDHLYRGKVAGKFVAILPSKDERGKPLALNDSLLKRGKERYGIYCTPCHDGAGTGAGIVVQRGMSRPPSLHEKRIRQMPIGEFYNVITNGVRNMPAYGPQILVRDRWAIATYIRALQIARNADNNNNPAEQGSE